MLCVRCGLQLETKNGGGSPQGPGCAEEGLGQAFEEEVRLHAG